MREGLRVEKVRKQKKRLRKTLAHVCAGVFSLGASMGRIPGTIKGQGERERWWTLGGAEVLDVMETVQRLLWGGQIVHIGTDAQKSSSRMEFVTVACVLNPGKGGRVFYTRRHDRKDVTLYEKLSTETWLSLDLAIRMHERFQLEVGAKQIWVHVDANPDERYDSSDYVKQLAGMVAGSGFPVLVKPNAWCASHVADYAVKNKHFRAKMSAA